MFDGVKEKDKIVEFIRDYYKESGARRAILGISGGKDSGVVAALMTEALGASNVIGLTLPCHSKDEDKNLARKVSDYYGFKLLNFDLTNVFDEFKNELNNNFISEINNKKDDDEKTISILSSDDTKDSDINIKPRLRMLTLYYMAALFSKLNNKTYLVCGTSNKCEIFVGYFTKGGDNVCDIAPIAGLTVSEVIKIGEVLNVPHDVLYKTPDDGLSGLSDEEKLGVKYDDIARFMEDENLVLDINVREKIRNMHEKNKHKFSIPKYIKE